MKRSKLTLLVLTLFWSNAFFGQPNPDYTSSIETLFQSLTIQIEEKDNYLKPVESMILPSELSALKKMYKRFGVPTLSKVGEEQAHQFLTMVLQCDQDVLFQFSVLRQMEKGLAKGEIIKKDFALLKDRIHLNKNIPQVFGTQYVLEKGSKRPELYMVSDPGNLEKRRLIMNLGPLPDPDTLFSFFVVNKS